MRSTVFPQRFHKVCAGAALLLGVVGGAWLYAQEAAPAVSPVLFGGLSWRLVGPWRGGKTTTVAGVPGDPTTYYFGTAGSGVWKTVNGGQTWENVSDSERLAGIASVVVAPSDARVVYVAPGGGRGAAAGGPSLYRSADAGASWKAVLQDAAVAQVLVNARNADDVLVAGSTGVSHSTDGGATWKAVLPQEGLRGEALAAAPDDAQVVYAGVATTAGGRGGGGARPSEGGVAPAMSAAEAAAHPPEVFVSTDGGATFRAASESGLPGGNHGTLALAVAPGTGGKRAYLYMAPGIWRTDDGGASWRRATDDPRPIGGGQFHSITVDPRNAQILYATQTSFYRSLDGGATWNSWTGAPSGADFNAIWINPADDREMVVGADQGTEITMDGGLTFTSWFNQPTGQLYNVTTDHRFPFTMFSAQQDSGTVATPIRGNDGQITYRDWYTTNGFESANIEPDPVDPNIIYSTGWYNSILRMDRRTGQTAHILETHATDYHAAGSPPMGFDLPFDPHTLYVGTQYLLRTSDGGQHWEKASPDLTEPIGGAAGRAGVPAAGRGGRAGGNAITALAFSPEARGEIWAGTNSGLLQLTRDNGATWQTVEHPGGGGMHLDASHFSAGRLYLLAGAGRGAAPGGARGAAAGRGAAASAAEVYRTDDFGKTWTPLVDGLRDRGANALREDPVNENLLFLSTPATVYVSFDRGSHWQSLELNLPNGSNRDLALEQNTLVVATYGRALWAIDDIGPLRALARPGVPAQIAAAPAYLYPPTPAVRLQWDTYTDTPLNRDVAASTNPPDGAILDYYLGTTPTRPVELAIYDGQGRLVRQYSSAGPSELPYKVNVPSFWLAPPPLLSTAPGQHRFVWNLRYDDPPQLLYTYYGIHSPYFEFTLADHAIPGNTPWHEPQGPMVLPGAYQVKLTVDGQTFTQPLHVTEDPRVTVTPLQLQRQLALSQQVVAAMTASFTGYEQADSARKALAAESAKVDPSLQAEGKAISEALDTLTDGGPTCGSGPGFGPTNCALTRYLIAIDQADAEPSDEVQSVFPPMCAPVNQDIATWNSLKTRITALNGNLTAAGLTAIPLPISPLVAPNCQP